MSRFHASRDAEKLAVLWHRIGFWTSAASVALGLGGVLWHRWAIKEHAEAIRELDERAAKAL